MYVWVECACFFVIACRIRRCGITRWCQHLSLWQFWFEFTSRSGSQRPQHLILGFPRPSVNDTEQQITWHAYCIYFFVGQSKRLRKKKQHPRTDRKPNAAESYHEAVIYSREFSSIQRNISICHYYDACLSSRRFVSSIAEPFSFMKTFHVTKLLKRLLRLYRPSDRQLIPGSWGFV